MNGAVGNGYMVPNGGVNPNRIQPQEGQGLMHGDPNAEEMV